MNKQKYDKIYIVCVPHHKTGGTELLHQLVYQINELGGNAMITYPKTSNNLYLNDAFKLYCNEYILLEDVEDNVENLIVYPEIWTSYLKKFKYINKSIFWMSVDNYLKSFLPFKQNVKFIIKHMLGKGFAKSISFSKFPNNIQHFVQSEYARCFLLNKGIESNIIFDLSDYINQIYVTDNVVVEKEDIILYNPVKGIEITKKIIEENKQFSFVPLVNLTNSEVLNLCKKAKLYIDFGNHPGKDRFPREAASQNCCVITNKNGSAKFYEDVSIDDCYKFEDESNIKEISKKIAEVLGNYDELIKDFTYYKNKIKNEKELFKNEVENLFFEVK